MSEENKMTEENKKTIMAFIAGLLVGGLLVFIFAEPSMKMEHEDMDDDLMSEEMESDEDHMDEMEDMDDEDTTSRASSLSVDVNTSSVSASGGSVQVADQSAGSQVSFSSAVFPTSEGWVGVRDFSNGQLSGLLGVARWSEEEGLMPSAVSLLRPTAKGDTYAIVFYTENGDHVFSLATDRQMTGVMETFMAE